MFADRPQAYADELIEALLKEKKRNGAVFILSQVMGLAGWFSITFGIINMVLSLFMEVDSAISLGNITVILGEVVLFSFSAVSVIFKIIHLSLFRSKNKQSLEYGKAGLFGASILLAWLVPEFGRVIQLQWWGYVLMGAGFAGGQ